ncbi:MAG TPA: CoB--CoM heterodisulfide reductase iron-sulfur subunit B family protein [Thermoleophilia bacterium]|nr:CoB--CoM heterodisulfide reductase iron-sulfur subunit B family protein [Thermoleophilia bacterium]
MTTVVENSAPAGAEDAARAKTARGVAYYPGCSLHGTSPEYDESLLAVVEALGVPVAEIPDWNCCGASSGHTTDHLLGVALPARNLALAEAQGFDRVLAPCAACYNRLAAANLAVATDPELAARMPEILGRPFTNSVGVFNAVQLLHEFGPLIDERVSASLAAPNPLAGVKLAAYYGCLLVRPPELAGGDDPEQPHQMDDIINACGADDVDWNMKVECCGGAFSVSRTGSVVRLGRSIIEDARRNGAEAIVVACPLCHSNLDLRQKAMNDRGQEPMPILYITQVVGLALGLPADKLGLGRHFVATDRFLEDLVVRAEQRAEEEERLQAEAEAKAAARAARRAEAGQAPATGGDAPAAGAPAAPDAGGDA